MVAEDAGLDSGWVGDHIVFPAGPSATRNPTTRTGAYPRPYTEPTLEAWTTLAFVAGFTQRLRLAVGVCVLPYRNPLILAKVVTTLDLLSEGRVLCGVGVGWLREEFEALHVPFERRRQRLVDGIAALRACWEGSPLELRGGEFDTAGPVHCVPTPTRRIPLFMGGHSEVALRRSVKLTEGWFGHNLSPREAGAVRERLTEAAGGALAPGFEVMVSRVMTTIGGDGGGGDALELRSPAHLADELGQYRDRGVDLFVCDAADRSGDALLGLIASLRDAGVELGVLPG